MKAALALFFLLQAVIMASAQESINPQAGINVMMHAGVALLLCFGILGSCTLGVNLIHKNMACARRD